MVQIRWSSRAFSDLQAIFTFISQGSEAYARIEVLKILRAVARLSLFPYIGKSLPELPHLKHRSVIVGQYRLIYRFGPTSKQIFVVAVIHGRRDLKH
jgi:toxin ParE1/3/4